MKLANSNPDRFNEWFDEERGLEVCENDDDVDEVVEDSYTDVDLL